MRPTDIEQPGTPREPQAPVAPSNPTQPGQGDDFTKPGKKNEQANMRPGNDTRAGRQSDEPVEGQNLKGDEDLALEDNEDKDNDARPTQTH